jgi:HSP20 family protein
MAKQSEPAAPEETLNADAGSAHEPSRIEMLREEVNRVFDMVHPSDWRLPIPSASGFEWRLPRVADWRPFPSVDLVETKKSFVYTAELPGLSEVDVEVKISNSTLVLSGVKNDTYDEGEGEHHFSERRFGQFRRSFHLPEGINTAKVAAEMSNGVLSVTFPKSASAGKNEKTVKIKTT